MSEINVVILDFPNTAVREAVTPNADGTYTIFLNAKTTCEMQRESYRHALRHIEGNDFEKDPEDIEQIEYEAHQHDKEERGFRDETTVIQRDF